MEELPRQFTVAGKDPVYKRVVTFQIYKEIDHNIWNGYYRDFRIKVWVTEITWAVQVYENSYPIVVWTNRKTIASHEEIERLIQVAIFFIDQIEKWRE